MRDYFMRANGTRRGVLLFLILLLCLVAIVFLGTEVFQVKRISILGSKTLDNNVIISLSGVSYGDNIFKISKEKVKNRIQDNAPFPIVEAISFKLPDEVAITVQERTPAAVIPYLSSYIVIDAGGLILDIIKQQPEVVYPVIDGLEIQNLTKGKPLDSIESDDYKQRILISLLEEIYACGVEDIIKVINMENPDDILLKTRDDIQIIVGQAVEIDKKLAWLQSDAYTEVLERDINGVMDISVSGKAIFRPESQLNEVGD